MFLGRVRAQPRLSALSLNIYITYFGRNLRLLEGWNRFYSGIATLRLIAMIRNFSLTLLYCFALCIISSSYRISPVRLHLKSSLRCLSSRRDTDDDKDYRDDVGAAIEHCDSTHDDKGNHDDIITTRKSTESVLNPFFLDKNGKSRSFHILMSPVQ